MEKVLEVFKTSEIKYLYNEITENLYSLQVFSYTQKESQLIKGIFEKYDLKFWVAESKI